MKTKQFILLLCLMLSSIVFGQDGDKFDVDGVRYMLTYDSYPRTQLVARTIPHTYSSFTPSSISTDNCLAGSVVLPDSVSYLGKSYAVTAIEYHAFLRCDQMTSIVLPKGVIFIGERAFEGCASLKSIALPDSLKSIGAFAFVNCKRLKAISLPNSLKEIGRTAFDHCENLISIHIPDAVTHIEEGAFENSGLQQVSLSEATPQLERWVFGGNLKSISVSKNNSRYMDREGVLFSKKQDTLFVYPAQKCETVYNIPLGIKEIMECAFAYNANLETITVPTSMHRIGYAALGGLHHLEKVVIPSTIRSIGGYAFAGNPRLKQIDLPNTIESIGRNAFAECLSLETIKLPNTITKIEKQTFESSGIVSIEIPNSVVEIGESAFADCLDLQSITLPDSLRKIVYGVVRDCMSLESIILPNSLDGIDLSAFAGSSIKKLTIPEGVKWITPSEFFDSLKSISIPQSVSYVAGEWGKNLEEMTVFWHNPEAFISVGRIPHNVILRVPRGTKELYEANKYFAKFKEIVEFDVE